MKKSWLVFLVACAMAIFFYGAAAAQDPTPVPGIPDDAVNVIAKQLYCPVCENTPLDVCPTQACAEWRELIRDLLAQGQTETQIKQYFVERFGDRVLAAPPARGLNWLIYIVPPIAILAGAFLLWRAFRSWQPARPPAGPAGSGANAPAGGPHAAGTRTAGRHTAEDDKYIERLEEELRKL